MILRQLEVGGLLPYACLRSPTQREGFVKMMSREFNKRVAKDIRDLRRNKLHGIECQVGNDLQHFTAVIEGVEDTIFEGAVFVLSIELSGSYPSEPPFIKFLTSCFHPNIYRDGKICLDILQKEWVATYSLGTVLQSIQQLLADPNPDSPANIEAANMFVSNKREYRRRVRQCVEASWCV